MAFKFGIPEPSPTYKIKKPIRLIELFGGVGTQSMALRDLGANYESWLYVDFDEAACNSYNAIHGTNYKSTNVKDVKGSDLKIVDKDKYEYILTYSFPCFIGNTLVLTKDGLKEIKDVSSKDTVMTHDGTYKKVLASKKTGMKYTFGMSTMSAPEIICTDNHKFLVRNLYRKNGKRLFSNPEWVSYSNLNKKSYLGYPINTNSIIPDWNGITFNWSDNRKSRHKNIISGLLTNENFWWVIGRYIGDGWERNQGGIIICCARGEEPEIIEHLKLCNFNYNITEERSVNKIHIPIKELSSFTNQFGKYAYGKFLPGFMFDLPENLLKSFIDGYWSADGSIDNKNNYRLSTVSKSLAMGMVSIISKVYKVPVKVYFNKRKPKVIIENRLCNQRNGYELKWKLNIKKQDKAFYENNFVWYPIRKLWKTEKIEDVYDIEVEDNHSFIANNAIVHNCTDLSTSGLELGMSRDDWLKGNSTRSGMLWEVERILRESVSNAESEKLDSRTYLPQILVMENVSQVHNSKNEKDWKFWLNFLENLGYKSFYKDLNARDFNVPQNRLRCFMISILGDYSYKFPEPPGLHKKIDDLLEQNVDSKFYLKPEKQKDYIDDMKKRGLIS